MRTTTIKFPLEHGLDHRMGNRVFDFLVTCVIDGDLELDETDLRSMRVTKYEFEGSYEDEGELYDFFDVELEGDDKAITNVETWFNQFNKPLQ